VSFRLGVLMDPIANIHIEKDSTFAMLLAAQHRNHEIYYLTPDAIWLENGIPFGTMQSLHVSDNAKHWYDLSNTQTQPLTHLDALLMRKDPPFNIDYVYLTYLLELAEKKGLLVINKPASLRDANEKIFASWFPQCCPKTLVTMKASLIKQFIRDHKEVVIKPLGAMAGQSIFRLQANDSNISVVIETMTKGETHLVMVQQFIPEIKNGDKRIILINGEPIPYALARIPAADDFRGNLAAGATGEGRPLTERDRWICQQVGPTLREKGLWFVGLDVIGDYLTEINVTSPTGIRQLDQQFGLDIGGQLIDFISQQLSIN
jgi:glutathione synthase